MRRRPPAIALLLGAAGLLPFLICGILAMGPDPGRAGPALDALLAYAAVILAFLGGVHWGFALARLSGPDELIALGRPQGARYVLGVIPSLIGWAALLLPQILPSWTALLLLIAGFIGTVVIEAGATRRGMVPRGYMRLRWALSVVVIAMLVTVATTRILGLSISV